MLRSKLELPASISLHEAFHLFQLIRPEGCVAKTNHLVLLMSSSGSKRATHSVHVETVSLKGSNGLGRILARFSVFAPKKVV